MQSVASPIALLGVMSSIPVGSHTFVEIDDEYFSVAILLLLIHEGLVLVTLLIQEGLVSVTSWIGVSYKRNYVLINLT